MREWVALMNLRRVFLVVLVALVLAALGVGTARAGTYGCSSGSQCDQGEAYSACMRHRDELAAGGGTRTCRLSTGNYWIANGGGTNQWGASAVYYFGSQCTQRNTTYPPGDAALNYVPVSDCAGGCKLVGEAFTSQVGGVTLYGMRNRTYVNETCDRPTDSNAPIDARADMTQQTAQKAAECTALGNGQTGCVKASGEYCATASTGKTFCWTPNQKGTKVDGQDAQVKGDVGAPVQPPSTVVAEKDWQRKEGHQVTECTGTSCKTSNVTNFSTVPQGTAKNSTGDNKPDGTGNTSGNGQQEQGKDSATESGNCESPPACVGDTLKCLHLKYTWKIECNTKGAEVTGGVGCSDADVPVCAGSSCKAEAYASVLQQWKQRCALEAMAAGNKARADGIDNGADAGVVDGIWITPGGNGPLTLRTDLVQVGGNGSLLPEIEIEGQTWNVPQGFFDAIAAVRMVIIAMCTVLAMFIVGRNI